MQQPTPRDYLANERTFLAYVRTALSFVAFGFVIARFTLFAREITLVEHLPATQAYVSNTLGVAMVVVGIVVAAIGAIRYVQQDRALRSGREGALSVRGAIAIGVLTMLFGLIIGVDLLRIR
jgi:putative membrane protein